MIALWLLYAVLIGAVAAGAAALMERVLRLWRLPVRWVWAVAMVSTLAAPAVVSLQPTEVPPAPPAGTAVLSAMVVAADAGPVAPPLVDRLWDAVAAGMTRLSRALAPLDGALLALWAGASAIFLLLLARSAVLLHWRRRGWKVTDVDGHRVLVARDTGPAVVGAWRPSVVLPAWAMELDAPLRRLVLRHEQEHLRARDPQLLLAGVVAALLAPWNAALWWQLGRLRLAVELDCDERVLRVHRDVERYGLLLMAVGQRTSGLLHLATPALSEPTTFLERRITAMTSRPTRRRALRAGLLLSGAALLVAGACMAPGPDRISGPGAPVTRANGDKADIARMDSAAAATGVYFEFQVENPVAQIPGTGSPEYPAELRAAGVSGDVIAQFVVDTLGVPELSTFKVLQATDPRFADAVRTALVEMRFEPALVGGRSVKQLVQQPFVFRVSAATPVTAGQATRPEPRAAVLAPTRARALETDTVRAGLRPARATRAPDANPTQLEARANRPATMLPVERGPEYPPELKAQGITGSVVVQFIVDVDGTVDAPTFRVLESDHPRFVEAVRAALPNLRFSPAEVDGRKVRQLVQTPFAFGTN